VFILEPTVTQHYYYFFKKSRLFLENQLCYCFEPVVVTLLGLIIIMIIQVLFLPRGCRNDYDNIAVTLLEQLFFIIKLAHWKKNKTHEGDVSIQMLLHNM